MATALEQLKSVWRTANDDERARFALEHALDCLRAVRAAHPTERPKPRARIDMATHEPSLEGRSLVNGEQVEALVEPGGRWIPAWIEGLPEQPRLCLRLAAKVVRVEIDDDLIVRRPTEPDPSLADYLAERLESKHPAGAESR
ncbi:MAG: hypothetical protein AAGD38_21430 [Acidobacteriota bacterium]